MALWAVGVQIPPPTRQLPAKTRGARRAGDLTWRRSPAKVAGHCEVPIVLAEYGEPGGDDPPVGLDGHVPALLVSAEVRNRLPVGVEARIKGTVAVIAGQGEVGPLNPAATILPSGWMATPKAISGSNPPKDVMTRIDAMSG